MDGKQKLGKPVLMSKKHFWLFHGTYAQRTETNPVRVKNHLHLIVLINSFTQTPRSKKYNLESETSHTLCTVSLCINFLSNALQKDGQLKHHTLKMRSANRNTACVTGWCQRDAKTAVNMYLCYNSNPVAWDKIQELRRTAVPMSTSKLVTWFMVTF